MRGRVDAPPGLLIPRAVPLPSVPPPERAVWGRREVSRLRGEQEGQDRAGDHGESLCAASEVRESIPVSGWRPVPDSEKTLGTENTDFRAT